MNIFYKIVFETFFENCVFGNHGDAKPVFFVFELLLRPWDLSHRVDRQKLMVTSKEETAVRPKKGPSHRGYKLTIKFRPQCRI